MTRRDNGRSYTAAVIGASAGGQEQVVAILAGLSQDFGLPILIVQHLHSTDGGAYADQLDSRLTLPVREADDKQPIQAGHVYVAPANYHLLVERTNTLALSVDKPVNWCRPSVDVLFESAACAWGDGVIGIIVSGTGNDGADGMCAIADRGGMTIAQDPAGAQSPEMPRAAIERGRVQEVLTPPDIAALLMTCGAVGRGHG